MGGVVHPSGSPDSPVSAMLGLPIGRSEIHSRVKPIAARVSQLLSRIPEPPTTRGHLRSKSRPATSPVWLAAEVERGVPGGGSQPGLSSDGQVPVVLAREVACVVHGRLRVVDRGEGERDGVVDGQSPAPLASLRESRLVELRVEFLQGLLVDVYDPGVASTDLLEESFHAGE